MFSSIKGKLSTVASSGRFHEVSDGGREKNFAQIFRKVDRKNGRNGTVRKTPLAVRTSNFDNF